MALDIKGDSFAGRYKRVNDYPIDTTDIWDTYKHALVYARNTDSVAYVPYAGQIVSVVEDGAIYKLEKDDSISEADGKKHFKLVLIGSKNDNDDRYLRRDIAETVQKLMTFLEGINVKGTATLEEITLLKNIVSKNFAAGSTGMGIYQDESGNYHLDIDFVNIRRKLTADEIQVQRSYYVGGKQWVTPGGGIICTSVEDTGSSYKCYFKATDAEGREVKCLFMPDDLAICETFNLVRGSDGKAGNHYYWRLVTATGADYICLSKANCDTGSDIPRIGDEIVHLGNNTDVGRQGAICQDAITTGGPYIRVYEGISGYHLPEPKIDLNPQKSIIKAQLISEATGRDVEDILNDMQDDLDIVKDQTDRSYLIWIFDYDPTLNNYPASEWNTNELKAMHEKDLFYNKDTGYGFRFEKTGDIWAWNNITDHQTLRALEKIKEKCKVFVVQPTAADEYSVGDMWINATYSDGTVKYKNDSLVCKTAKAKGVAFSIDHWKPSSTATTAYLENLGDQIILAVTNSDDGIAAAKELANQGINDAYAAAQSALNALGIAQSAQSTADQNTAAIQVTKDSISALVEGIHFDSKGNVTNIDTSGLVTTDDFNVLLSKKVNFDSGGHITNISTSGLVTEAGFAQMFSDHADHNGYVKRAEISTFITEDDVKGVISNAVISADQIRFNGNIVANDTFVVDTDGNLTLNNITVSETGEFKGRVSIADEKILLENDGSGHLAGGKISWGADGHPVFEGKVTTATNGKRIEIDSESNSLKMCNENNKEIATMEFIESIIAGNSDYLPRLTLRRFVGDIQQDYTRIDSNSIYIETRMAGGDTYRASINPEYGILFYKNGVLSKSYPNS